MSPAESKANARRSELRSAVKHVLARQKDKIKLLVCTIGTTRATLKIGIANIAYSMLRYVWQDRRQTPA
jgi:transposase, IS5 family